jgi:hypothetical protein
MLKTSALAATIVLSSIISTHAEQTSSVTCGKVDGMIQSPIIATAQTAREIYKIVAHSRGEKIKRGDKIVVNDDGSHWSVTQYPATCRPIAWSTEWYSSTLLPGVVPWR